MLQIRFTLYCALLWPFLVLAQELPPIVKYSPSQYGAGNQNWMIAQDKNRYVFFANNEGLLEYNGSNWKLYPSPNETIMRSVKVIDNKIYTGCFMEFGYWKRMADGQLQYFSLSNKVKKKILDDEQFWNILNYDQWVVFQSLNRLYIYDNVTHQFNIIKPKNNIIKSFATGNSIYFQTQNEGLFEIENGKSKLVCNHPKLQANRIINVFATDEGLLIQTQLDGLYKLVSGNLSKMNMQSEAVISASSIYSAQQLSDGTLALGTISNGLFIVSAEGKILYNITQNKGLSNNTVLSVYEDADKNLWVGLDNGINCINLQTPVKCFYDNTGILGTIYTSILHQNKLYIGSNQGLFYKNYNSAEDFKFIAGTKGQVWSLFAYDGSLFCGHDSGTFLIDNDRAQLIFSQSGTWKFSSIPNAKHKLLQGNYYGLSVLEKINDQWVFKNKINGFNYSAKYFEINNNNEVYLSHEYKGVFRLNLNNDFTVVTQKLAYASPSKGKNASLAKFNNDIYYAYKDGIFVLNPKTKQFDKDNTLSRIFEKDEYTSGKLIVDSSNKIWLFSKNYIHYFTLSKLSHQIKQNIIPIPASLTNSMLGYENISQLSNSVYLIGTTDGYYTININDLSFKNYEVFISNVSVNQLNYKDRNFSIAQEGDFKSSENNIAIGFTVPEYNKYINTEYQYLLEGFQEQWSEWSAKSTVNFKNLSPGSYVFKVRARLANSASEKMATYRFTISKPWYATHLALLIYFVLFLILARVVHKAYKSYYQKQKDKLIEENNLLLEIKELESERQLMKLRNEQLSQDVDSKNKALAVSTMSLINKNELLSVIKEDLKNTGTDDGNRSIKSLINTINKNISEEDNWNIFKEAFDSTDKDFLKKMKALHSSLTPNDLRLCAYLRLNLSSKEIAPLLYISVRSVEIKRYRLRKKMNLPHEMGLVEYILSI
ncbi:helix-turn-helix and ligand-binding sensor domain-containing protein [Flavobacterium lotistagni]|uniref:helix-turn-helix and ligand-binding sensor domain-containing protein n=1 Tax=Flavobacterium lotistagni TaxID=2709660 RepID=UPI001F1F33DD|nr:triple tyrosine motif-containing protein [Flavobacterium lotistagni]